MAKTTNSLDVFILAGQSNMAGRGGVQVLANHTKVWDGIVPVEANAPDGTSILRLSAALQWEVAKEPLHYDIDTGKVCGVGPGLVFAASVLRILIQRGEKLDTIGLVPCAIGATSIVEWEKGGALYNQMITRAQVARESGETLKGLLWYQGETDAGSKQLASAYQTRLEKFFKDMRSDLQEESLPIIQVLITGSYRYVHEVRAAQSSVRVPGVYTVDAWGLALNPDNIHLTTKSQTKVGTALSEKYMNEVHDQYHAKA